MKLQGRLVEVPELTSSQRDEMFALLDRHYEGVRRQVFDRDLSEKRWVILIAHPSSQVLCGFSTQTILKVDVQGRAVHALFSGDTIISKEHWGDQALTHIWGRLALSLMDDLDVGELYWFLISKGYKTYRFLPVFFHEFYPRIGVATPVEIQTALDALAKARYPQSYDATVGVIRTDAQQYRLRDGVADITPGRLQDEHVRFFQFRNPGHSRGDELCCLAPLTRDNFTNAAYRVIGQDPVLKI